MPSTLDRRLLKDNEFYWDTKIDKNQIDIAISVISKLRTAKKMFRDGKQAKEPAKDEVCSEMYYRRKKEKQYIE